VAVTDPPFPFGRTSLGNQHFQHGPDRIPSCVPSTYVRALIRLFACRRVPYLRPPTVLNFIMAPNEQRTLVVRLLRPADRGRRRCVSSKMGCRSMPGRVARLGRRANESRRKSQGGPLLARHRNSPLVPGIEDTSIQRRRPLKLSMKAFCCGGRSDSELLARKRRQRIFNA
jgi:hypothetical protein